MIWKRIATALAFLCVFQAGLLLGRLVPNDAHAEEPQPEQPIVPFYDPPRLYCRLFQVPLEGAGTTFETSDVTTEIGKWVQKEEESYELFTLDFEVGQKSTGYPQGHVQVCLSPRRF